MSTAYDYKKFAILYVDDEEQALKYFRKAMEKEFRILTATNVADANAILDKEWDKIAVVITDQRMPKQTGVELLTRVRQNWPGIIRMFITAYSDMDSAIGAVNAGAISRYITKPANLKELRDTLMAAMEQFLRLREQQTVLHERLDVLQRMVVADRVKSLAAMAGGISHHLRNSMTALTCFLEEVAPGKPGDMTPSILTTDPKFAEQLWALAYQERERLVRIVQQVGDTVLEPHYQFDAEIGLEELVRLGIKEASGVIGSRSVSVQVAPGVPAAMVDAPKATHLVRLLLNYVARFSPGNGNVSVTVKPDMAAHKPPGVQIFITGAGAAWSDNDVAACFTPFAFPAANPADLGLDLISAFSIAYHHGGDILIHKAPPLGPGFELRLPADPSSVQRPELQESLMEKLFSRFDRSDAPTEKAA